MLDHLISPDFTVDDIHKIREYNYDKTKNMTMEQRRNYYKNLKQSGMDLQKKVEALRQLKQQ